MSNVLAAGSTAPTSSWDDSRPARDVIRLGGSAARVVRGPYVRAQCLSTSLVSIHERYQDSVLRTQKKKKKRSKKRSDALWVGRLPQFWSLWGVRRGAKRVPCGFFARNPSIYLLDTSRVRISTVSGPAHIVAGRLCSILGRADSDWRSWPKILQLNAGGRKKQRGTAAEAFTLDRHSNELWFVGDRTVFNLLVNVNLEPHDSRQPRAPLRRLGAVWRSAKLKLKLDGQAQSNHLHPRKSPGRNEMKWLFGPSINQTQTRCALKLGVQTIEARKL
ncbi:hypothetical protein C8F04DRAFT_1305878 [Mycena alexandri]|uniref:Uncharacterized protein n=1 Tax=Mycena alexandri TaxID=1745969 RepID=A0AAD6X6P7_9AGAR|nr:hypothetical protein C8F04DRAFT_1305878 [Mycena alexandri]